MIVHELSNVHSLTNEFGVEAMKGALQILSLRRVITREQRDDFLTELLCKQFFFITQIDAGGVDL